MIFWRTLIGKIKCYCGKCEIIVVANKALGSFLCGCQDCRQAVKWAEFKGGQKGEDLQHTIYVPSDILRVKGKENMKPFLLREGGQSIRVYCVTCYSLLGVDFPVYNDQRFMFIGGHCVTDIDTSMDPAIAINMVDYPKDKEPSLPDGITVVNSIHDPDRDWTQIPEVKKIRETPPSNKGIRFSELIKELGSPTILGFEPGGSVRK